MARPVPHSYLTDVSIKSLLDTHKHDLSSIIDIASTIDSLTSAWENANNSNTIAKLDGTGLVPTGILPSYVNDVLEYANLASFPVTGETGKIYVALDTNIPYFWDGSSYTTTIGSMTNDASNVTSGTLLIQNGGLGLGTVTPNNLITKTGTSFNEISNGTIAGQILYTNIGTAPSFKKPDNGVFRVNDYGGVGDDSTDNATAISNCYTAIVSNGGGIMQFDIGTYRFSSFPSITQNNVIIRGSGNSIDGGTILAFTSTFSIIVSANNIHVCDLMFFPSVVLTSGYCLNFDTSSVRCDNCSVKNVSMKYCYSGISCIGTNCRFEDIEITHILGNRGFLYTGENTNVSNDCTITNMICNFGTTAYDGSWNSWSTSKSFFVGNIVLINGNYYRCSAAGTSASSGTGPSGYPSYSSLEEIFTNTITDGTVRWNFVFNQDHVWLYHSSYANNLTTNNVKMINGNYGIYTGTLIGTGQVSGSYHYNMNAIYQFSEPVLLFAGINMKFISCYLSFSIIGNGILTYNTAGNILIKGCQIVNNERNGMAFISGSGTSYNYIVDSNIVCNNGQQGASIHQGIIFYETIHRFQITNNYIGTSTLHGGNLQNYPIWVYGTNHDYYVITGNISNGNATNTINDQGTGSNKVIANNTL